MASHNQGDFSQKRISAAVQGLRMHRDLWSTRSLHCTAARLAKEEELGHDLLPLGVPHRLIKAGQQGLRDIAWPRETSFNRGTEMP